MVIVDDNSPDGTGAVADDLARTLPVRVVHRSGKLGLGTAVVAGFEVASAAVVGVMDADFSHPPALVPRLLAVLDRTGADIVIGSRYIPGGSTPNWPLWRRVLSRAACMAARPLSPVRDRSLGVLLDPQGGDEERRHPGGRLQDLSRTVADGPGRDASSRCRIDSRIESRVRAR